MSKRNPAAASAQRADAEAAKKARRRFMADSAMLGSIRRFSLLFMVAAPILVDAVLRAAAVYLDTDIAVFYPSTAVTVLQWLLYYLLLILTYLYQGAGYGILGYSVLRYGIRRSLLPILLTLFSATFSYAAGIVELIYLSGTTAVKNNLSYLVIYWLLNYFLSLFTCLCLIFLCALLRTAFLRQNRGAKKAASGADVDPGACLQVQIGEETPEDRRKNALRRLYRWMTGMLFLFRFVPTAANTYSEIISVGAPEDIWDWITLLQPYAELLLLSALVYFFMLQIGALLSEKNEAALLRAKEDAE